MKTYHTFKTPELFQKWLQTKHDTCHPEMKYGGCLDYVTVAGVLYTMHEYDSAGKTITWANKKHGLMLEMTTSDRYTRGYSDAEVIAYPSDWLRNDISYAE
ncbi:MAG: hypothetical protein ACYDAK_13265 [Candidatus Limnocylindrales bacterium]